MDRRYATEDGLTGRCYGPGCPFPNNDYAFNSRINPRPDIFGSDNAVRVRPEKIEMFSQRPPPPRVGSYAASPGAAAAGSAMSTTAKVSIFIILFIAIAAFAVLLAAIFIENSMTSKQPDEDVCREVIMQWKRIMEETDDAQKISLYETIIHHIARHNDTVGNELETEYFNAASNLTSQAAKLFFEDWYVLLITYADAERLTTYLQNEAEKRSNWARTFLGNAPLIAHSTVAGFSKEFLSDDEKQTWSLCLDAVADTVRSVANELRVSATSEFDIMSGLPEFPIYGNLHFIQPLLGGMTRLEIHLRGFNDTTKHGFHVHQFGSTANQCYASGHHFNPHNKEHGGPEDQERHVGDLGNVQADDSGQVVETRHDWLISLYGVNNIVGRVADVHLYEDDLGRGGQPNSKRNGNAGVRLACGLIKPRS